MTATTVVDRPGSTTVRDHTVVAVVLTWRGRVGLFRRSAHVDHDQGLWHCVTGYLERGAAPLQQALTEIHEETGLGVADLDSFSAHDVLALRDARGDVWTVHTFLATTTRRRLTLDQEHDAHRWVDPRAVPRFANRVGWLTDVLDATGVGEGGGLAGRASS